MYFFNKILYALSLEEVYSCHNILRRENFSTFQQMFYKPHLSFRQIFLGNNQVHDYVEKNIIYHILPTMHIFKDLPQS